MTEAEFHALLRAARDRQRGSARRDFYLFYLMGRTGLRISEALELKVEDLSLGGPVPYLWVRTLKRRRPAREPLELDVTTARALKTWKREAPGPYLFASSSGARMTRRNALYLFRFYARRAGLRPDLVLHSLRHYHGSRVYQKTRHLKFTSQAMRHRSTRSTLIYTHVDPESRRRFMEDLAK